MPSASRLYRNFLAYQVFGANTEVGKTVFSTVLCKAFLNRSRSRLHNDALFNPYQNRTLANVWYLKPVSTGPSDEADTAHLKRFAVGVETKCLFQYGEAVSPHIAAGKGTVDTDSMILSHIGTYFEEFLSERLHDQKPGEDPLESVILVEGAGGVHSPTPSGTSQADLYRPLRLPVFLVADPKLGGISSTISAFESLHIRGYDLDSVLVFEDEKYRNHEYLSQYFSEKGISTASLPPPPSREDDTREDHKQMQIYYENMSASKAVQNLLESTLQRHKKRINRLESLPQKAHETIWYPFTQMKNIKSNDILAIDSAYGDFFQTLSENKITNSQTDMLTPSFDGSASWWTQGLGHGSPSLSLSAAYAAGRYGHVIFANTIHEPGLALAELLLKHLNNPRSQRVFYSDDGSTGMEVAIKMALTATSKRYGIELNDARQLGVLGLKGSYHGDTIGAMDMSPQSTFNAKVHWYQGRGYWFDFPQVMMHNREWIIKWPQNGETVVAENKFTNLDEIFDKRRDDSKLRAEYEQYILNILQNLQEYGIRFGALVIEPILLGAGGMLFCDPLFQRTLVDVVRSNSQLFGVHPTSTMLPQQPTDVDWSGLPIIFDEVFTGLYRLGHFTPSTMLQIQPDISVHAKLLTGGLLPLCATVASNPIYSAFLSDEKSAALLHGHSYTGHAVGCQVAVTSLNAMISMQENGAWNSHKSSWSSEASTSTDRRIWSFWPKEAVSKISQAEDVDSVFALGTVLAIKFRDKERSGYTSMAAEKYKRLLLERNCEGGARTIVHSRVLGNVLYIMSSLVSEPGDLKKISDILLGALQN